MSLKTKGYLFSYIGLYLGLILVGVVVTCIFFTVGTGISNNICSGSCDTTTKLTGDFAGGLIGLFVATVVSVISTVTLIPLSIYILLRLTGQRKDALKTSFLTLLFLLIIPVSLLLHSIGTGLLLTLDFIWLNFSVFLARKIATKAN